MCRLFAFVSPDRSTAERELGETGMESLRSLARLHGDGWGWAGVERTGTAPEVRTSPRSASADPAFADAMAEDVHAAVVHLRWATSGLPITAANTHPFRIGDVAFAHNGTLKPIGRARELLAPASLAAMVGDTDSEMYFRLIREQLDAGVPLFEATLTVVRRLREAFPLASLNALVMDAEQLVVVHASALSILSDDDLGAIARLDRLPDEHNEDYYALRWTQDPDGTVRIGSTGVARPEWPAMPAESVTAIRLDDRTSVTVQLAGAEAPFATSRR
ncbi:MULTISPECIES: class II glutamine amidotransferase [Microbacterium]|uniref:class II glutamine amidotransferase n=1 Tax=Microbacterium TaxID=33882 RepID=UPI00217CF128|nr:MULTISPECIES: class II glutamine amidotransferase [Microbacterium]UWF77989.1 class II glutamine amidotransferase [Microbacterium neungamense]WCM56167.1 class II glutamine amidotransferase [Microbacterium sp. EF45047]